MTESDLIPCNDVPGIKDLNIDPVPQYCSDQELDCDGKPIKTSQKEVTGRDFSWLEGDTLNKKGIGENALCDPILKGHIINDQDGMGGGLPDRTTVYKYSKALRGTDEAVQDLFRDIIVIDEQGKAHQVPIIWATQEKAVAYILQDNTRKDNSLVVDRIRLPILAIHASETTFNQDRYVYHKAIDWLRDVKRDNAPGFTTREFKDRDTVFGVAKGIPLDITYTLYVWTLYREDINQIAEQILMKLTPMGYIRVRGVSWEIGVKLTSIANNIELDPGDKKVNIYKYQFTMTAETYVPQPIVRKKAVLQTRTDFVDDINEENISEIIGKIEEAVKELEDV